MLIQFRALSVIVVFIFSTAHQALSNAGFSLPTNVDQVTLKFETISNLVILPVIINDSVHVNLILDTGCRNLVLFGKKFQKYFTVAPNRNVQFSGLGDGKPVTGKLALNNKVSIQAVLGESIPIVIVPQQNIFASYPNVHGIIGYDIFIKFEIELNPMLKQITFRPASTASLSAEYEKIPLRIEDSRPLITSTIFFPKHDGQICDLMLDTGSTLSLLMKTSDVKNFPTNAYEKILGKGLNGDILGIETTAGLLLEDYAIPRINAAVTYSAWHNYASVGMDILKNYTLVLNYCKSYAGLKKII